MKYIVLLFVLPCLIACAQKAPLTELEKEILEIEDRWNETSKKSDELLATVEKSYAEWQKFNQQVRDDSEKAMKRLTGEKLDRLKTYQREFDHQGPLIEKVVKKIVAFQGEFKTRIEMLHNLQDTAKAGPLNDRNDFVKRSLEHYVTQANDALISWEKEYGKIYGEFTTNKEQYLELVK